MTSSTLSTKGQLVIPKAVREHMGLRAGDRLDFVVLDSGDVLIRPACGDVRDLKGMLPKLPGRPVSLAKMGRAVRDRAKGRS